MAMKIAWKTCALAALLLAPRSAAAQSPGCTFELTSLPYTINSSGTYCLKSTMFTNLASGAAITIGGGYQVTVDLRGFALINVYGPTTAANGVQGANKSNVTVRNGRIQSFKSGVTLDGPDSYSNVVENVQVDQPYVSGIVISGNGHQIRGCSVTHYGQEDSSYPVGILISGDGHLVEGNLVTASLSGTGRGISVFAGTNHLVVGNRIVNPQGVGMHLHSNDKYRDNLVTGALSPYQGGLDAGNNQ
jgi:hypothetical protein